MKLKPLHMVLIGVAALAAGIGIPAILSKRKDKQLLGPGGDPYVGPGSDPYAGPISGARLSSSEAIMIAGNLFEAMNGIGTNEAAIFENLNRCQTKDDLLRVIQKFGARKYALFGEVGDIISVGTGIFTMPGNYKDLNGWLRAELNRKELVDVKAIFDKLNVPF